MANAGERCVSLEVDILKAQERRAAEDANARQDRVEAIRSRVQERFAMEDAGDRQIREGMVRAQEKHAVKGTDSS